MKLGILNAFPPDESIIDWRDTPVDAYIRFLELVRPPFDYVGYDVARGQFPDSPDACDAYLITGSPKGVYESEAWISELAKFIREAYQAGIKLVGICFGHQILAQALGGHCEKSEKGWGLGLKSFQISRQKAWMTANSATCSLHFVHQDQVIHLPPEAELLGGNDFCPNLFFTISDGVLGIQGHPEFTKDMMQDILEARKDIFGQQVYETAMRSMESGTPDNQLLAQWVVNFLLRK
ncbi:MAG: GMP synthase [Anaerolineales bacterium]|nr:GMP synthase [Anaerolineales bacterium]